MSRPIEQWTDQGATVMVRFASGVLGFVSLDRPVVAGFDLRGSTGQITFSTNVGDAWKVTSRAAKSRFASTLSDGLDTGSDLRAAERFEHDPETGAGVA